MTATVLSQLAEWRSRCQQLNERAGRFLGQPGPVDDGPLTLALLGYFNAGKSTLLNALLGQNVEAMAAAPETARVRAYEWNGLRILDMPGSQARAADAAEASSGLRRAHAVLYVLSSEKLDDGGILEELRALREARVPFLVVVNEQHRFSDEQHRADTLKQLEAQWANKVQALPEVQTFWVNAELARRGRQENKLSLVEHSRVERLEASLLRMLAGADESIKGSAHLRSLRGLLLDAQLRYSCQLAEDDAKELANQLTAARHLEEQLDAMAQASAQDRFPVLETRLRAALEGALNDPLADMEDLKWKLNEHVVDTVKEALDSYHKQTLSAFKRLAPAQDAQLVQAGAPRGGLDGLPVPSTRDVVKDLGEQLNTRHVSLAKFLRSVEAKEMEQVLNLASKTGVRQLPGGGTAKLGWWQAHEVAKQSRAMAEQAKTLSKQARLIGVGVTVALLAVDIVAAVRKARAEDKLLAAQLTEIHQIAALEALKQREWFLAEARGLVDAYLSPFKAQCQADLRALKGSNREVSAALREVEGLLSELDALMVDRNALAV